MLRAPSLYTTSPVHTLDMWLDLAKQIEDMGATRSPSRTWPAFSALMSRLIWSRGWKATLSIPIHLYCHATAGLPTAAIVKAVDAGIDNVDTAISSLSMTYGHSPTESVVAIFKAVSAIPVEPGVARRDRGLLP